MVEIKGNTREEVLGQYMTMDAYNKQLDELSSSVSIQPRMGLSRKKSKVAKKFEQTRYGDSNSKIGDHPIWVRVVPSKKKGLRNKMLYDLPELH